MSRSAIFLIILASFIAEGITHAVGRELVLDIAHGPVHSAGKDLPTSADAQSPLKGMNGIHCVNPAASVSNPRWEQSW
ncbi:hypothetical protein [Myxococcus sp. AB025B]|uniref:hypothetical protein n=1 Tax=Myxococcus sp. AB025B TaxID=2562794 RepID=UPI001142EE95|nr:hypothetical protein [Myxococcus sp. AB025B]